jgi:hypothetical protein
MKRFVLTAAVVMSVAGLTGQAFAACELTAAPPTIPDGATAAEPDMLAAQQAVKQFVGVTQEFTQCLELESKGRMSNSEQKKFDDANEQMQKIAKDFNKQLKAFKSR